ncbi:uncharacterized protein LOC131023368 [Salvia miltiorrhiza]|uniref:uncharacterized protein LOC131023368 n=1 Tax=Salvia miltiorrhiza TaxID=226208 RepID=UPI0025AB8700|nr:uncharacterized protein LOC131023368 [Salvia miltiorrhiza]
MASLLVGPPEIYAQSSSSAATDDVHIRTMVSNFRRNSLFGYWPEMAPTENICPTFLSTGNPCLDFFFHVVPDTPPETLINRLRLAWDHDPLKALKLVCNLRGVRGTGKSDKEGFYTAALWLHHRHSKTLAANVAAFADFGYLKDLLEILFRILEGPKARQSAKEMGEKWKVWKWAKAEWVRVKKEMRNCGTTPNPHLFTTKQILKAQLMERRRNLETGQTRQEKRLKMAKRAVKMYNEDPNFKLLHDQVSDVFAQRLRSDMEMLKSGDLNKISLAAKWCPSLDSSFDRITLLCETIAKKVFPRAEYAEYQGVEEAHYAYRVRDRLRKEVLVPLRKRKRHNGGNYSYKRVASVAMKTNCQNFYVHDGEKFSEYLDRVRSGEAKIAAGALLPHEMTAAFASRNEDSLAAKVSELQWKRMVEDMAKKGKLSNCLAVSDVSGARLNGFPMEASVALGVLVSELSEEPWKGKLITFNRTPQLHILEGDSLKGKVNLVRRHMQTRLGNTSDLQKVFDVILQVAEKGKLKAEEMIKRLFVFSDMEFDNASLNPWETDYEVIVRKFREKGYGECVPEIVFWNLKDSKATPVPANQPGVALVSGYSKNLMTLFLEEGGVMDPVAVMEAAISGEEYNKLVVLD